MRLNDTNAIINSSQEAGVATNVADSLMETDPITYSVWLKDAINTAQFGIRLES